ncbi:MAG: hypothetical protein QGG67_15445 [Gammaproteobacteria bacterium]|jgi:hypothetical protein|nr:hypothetical protein [Gammaproteobacteria bacterium]|tara:strand:+ start:435 stop:710 length:276 start_codon:yes stop_codon:yes gene_type:complete
MKSLLEKYVGQTIGINIERPHHIDAAKVLAAEDAYFSVHSSADQHVHHIPYANVIKVIEDDEGVEIRHLFTANERFNVIVKVGHVVVYMPA